MNYVVILDWLKSQNYQIEHDVFAGKRCYSELDMPEILEDYYRWKNDILNDVKYCECVNPKGEGNQAECGNCGGRFR